MKQNITRRFGYVKQISLLFLFSCSFGYAQSVYDFKPHKVIENSTSLINMEARIKLKLGKPLKIKSFETTEGFIHYYELYNEFKNPVILISMIYEENGVLLKILWALEKKYMYRLTEPLENEINKMEGGMYGEDKIIKAWVSPNQKLFFIESEISEVMNLLSVRDLNEQKEYEKKVFNHQNTSK